jgi:hypothetical protein
MKKEGGCEWYQSMALKFVNIPANFLLFLKGPGPLNHKKRISAA